MSSPINKQPLHSRVNSFGRDMMMAGVGASIAKTITSPVERVKLLLQLQATSTQIAKDKQYKGILDCFRRVPKEQGFLSFWRGNLTNIYRYFLAQAFNFAFKEVYKPYIGNITNKTDWKSVLAANLVTGSAAGVTSIVITYPLDFARTRLTADVGRGESRQFRGLYHCMSSIVKSDGVRGLYFGLSLSIPTVILYRGVYFGVYDTLNQQVPTNSLFVKWLYAQSTTTMAGLICYPMDTVRRRLVMQGGRKITERHYSGYADCVRKIYLREGGMGAFYKGALSNVLRGFGGAIVLVLYDELKRLDGR